MRTLSDIQEEGLQPEAFAAIVAEKLGTAEKPAALETQEDTTEPVPSDAVAESEPAPDDAAPQPDPEPLPDGTYEDENGRLRGPDGKFVAKGTEEHEHDPDATPEPEPQPEEWVLDVDPDVQSFLEKYDGDLNKALRGAIEAQKVVGRQGSELGELRKVQQDLEALKTTLLTRQAEPQPQVLPDYRGMIDEDPRTAAVTAYENQHWDAMGAALAAWKEEDPVEARLFAMQVKSEADLAQQRHDFEQRLAAAQPPQGDPQQEFVQAMTGLVQRYPDLEATLPAIDEVSRERPLLRSVLESGSPADRAAALEDLYLIAKSRTVASDTSEAVRQVQVRVSDEARQARAAAAVVSSSGASAATGDQPTKADEFRSAFADKLREQGLWAGDVK